MNAPRTFYRSDRVSGQLRRELGRLIQRELKDPAVGFVSVSDVEVSRDLAHAKVFVTVLDESTARESIRVLKKAAGFLRSRLGRELRMRNVPELHFQHDDSIETGERMDQLISDAVASDQEAAERSGRADDSSEEAAPPVEGPRSAS